MCVCALQDGDDIEDLAHTLQPTPAVVRNLHSQYFLTVEGLLFLEVDEFLKALIGLIGLYYILNIKFAKPAENTLGFLAKNVLKIPSAGVRFPPSVNATISDINNCIA